MAKIFITGSADGLGYMAAKLLISQGHQVVLHARNAERAKQAWSRMPAAGNVLEADVSHVKEIRKLAAKVNSIGYFDAVIHNVGVYSTVIDPQEMFVVNTLTPYILTCLIQKPKRLVYLSSGMHLSGDPGLKNNRRGYQSYSDTKLHDLILCKAVARKWTDVYANAVDPGWVATKMGGPGAPDNLEKGAETQAWLAVSNDDRVKVSGHYFHHKKETRYHPAADDTLIQDKLLAWCQQISGVSFPAD